MAKEQYRRCISVRPHLEETAKEVTRIYGLTAFFSLCLGLFKGNSTFRDFLDNNGGNALRK